jgi:hypothetical protein
MLATICGDVRVPHSKEAAAGAIASELKSYRLVRRQLFERRDHHRRAWINRVEKFRRPGALQFSGCAFKEQKKSPCDRYRPFILLPVCEQLRSSEGAVN